MMRKIVYVVLLNLIPAIGMGSDEIPVRWGPHALHQPADGEVKTIDQLRRAFDKPWSGGAIPYIVPVNNGGKKKIDIASCNQLFQYSKKILFELNKEEGLADDFLYYDYQRCDATKLIVNKFKPSKISYFSDF